MQLHKKDLTILYQVLRGTEGVLTLSEGRVRDALMKPLTEATKQFEIDRNAIYAKFAQKGAIKKEGDKTTWKFDKKNVPKVNKEIQLLYAEQVELPVPDAKRLVEIIERTQYKPAMGETEAIDAIIKKILEF